MLLFAYHFRDTFIGIFYWINFPNGHDNMIILNSPCHCPQLLQNRDPVKNTRERERERERERVYLEQQYEIHTTKNNVLIIE